ncbi:MAG: type 4a pilus biogenesis protein PilO [Gammaproteobacteria bacterium]|nr:MAG: type 4a pilus biogenesis protein PilO [Gammaproteobacteria bacterium]
MNQFFEDLRNLDVNDVGRWPFVFRAIAISLIFVAIAAAGIYYTVYKKKIPILEAAQAQEQTLRGSFELKQRKAANFDAYKEQLAEIEQSFGAMLRQLPGKTEVPNLLVDISQTGLAAGLEEELFKPQGEIVRDFYAELPIQIRLAGTYHELARFVSDVAALPRIVTIHDVSLKEADENAGATAGNADDLVMSVTAKTYRYLEEGEEQT